MVWGELHLDDDTATRIRLGPLCLDVHRRASALWVEWSYGDDPFDPSACRLPLDSQPGQRARRLVFTGDVVVRPALADRAVVARPDSSVILGPESTTEFFLSTPVWLTLCVGDSVLLDLPSSAVRSTWFGASATEGELAYSSRTRLLADELSLRRLGHRASTRIEVQNHGRPLELTHLHVPAPQLSLVLDAGRLWTEPLTMVAGAEESATIGPVSGLVQAPPRVPGGPRTVVRRVFNALMPNA